MSAVRVGPIPFSAPLAPMVLADLKTQTRRGLTIPAGWEPGKLGTITSKHPKQGKFGLFIHREVDGFRETDLIPCPYGSIGDRLYVKEDYYQYGHWEPVEGVKTKGGKQKWRFVPDSEKILFEAPFDFNKSRHPLNPEIPLYHKRLGRFMPWKYSRTLLEVTDIRVERLNEISEQDAKAEGVEAPSTDDPRVDPDYAICPRCGGTGLYTAFGRNGGALPDTDCELCDTHAKRFRFLWESINGAGTFDDRWVWVICFKRVQP